MRLLVLSSLFAIACAQTAEITPAAEALIYGQDDRRDLTEIADPGLKALATESTAALIDRDHLTPIGRGRFKPQSGTLGGSLGLCPSERFLTQPIAANCSGVLIDDALILTAGHCSGPVCGSGSWVFGYAGEAPEIGADAIYACQSVPLYAHDASRDYAIVQLDRAVGPRQAPTLAAPATEVQPGQPVRVIGYPEGLPVKLDLGAHVLEVAADNGDLTITSDTYVGSSGSGVFDAEDALIGIVIGGGSDYELDRARGCYVSRRLDDPPHEGGERVIDAASVIAGLCQSGWPSERLCGAASVSVDGARRQPARCGVLQPRAAASAWWPMGCLSVLGALSLRRACTLRRRPRSRCRQLSDGVTISVFFWR